MELATAAVSVILLHIKRLSHRSPSLLAFQIQRAPHVRLRHLRLHGQERPGADHHQGRRGSGEAAHMLQRTSGPVLSAPLPATIVFVLVISQVVKMSNNWWLIRNNRGEEGNVPRNVVELKRSSSPLEDQQVRRATLCSSPELRHARAFNPFVLHPSGTQAGPSP